MADRPPGHHPHRAGIVEFLPEIWGQEISLARNAPNGANMVDGFSNQYCIVRNTDFDFAWK